MMKDINTLSIEEKIGQMFMVGFDGFSLNEDIEEFIDKKNIGGIILFSRNIDAIEQIIGLNNAIHSLAKISPMIWTDQEGGNIVRFGELAATGISHRGIHNTGNKNNAEIIASIIARDMKKIGIDGIFAPILDVNTNKNNPVIGIRAFSDNPDEVVEYAREFIRGFNAENIANCGKHYPGHGVASADSHLEIPVISLSKEDFEESSISPFLQLSKDLDSIMSAHVKYPNISDDIGTFSKELILERLKNDNGFHGVIFSDCLEMRAISDNFSSEEIVYNSINAGIDVLIVSHTHSLQKEYIDIALRLVKQGKIKQERIDDSVSRILKLKEKYSIGKNRIKNTPIMRQSINIERKIAFESIKILKDKNGILPIDKNSKSLFMEFTREIKSPSVLSDRNSAFESILKNLFTNSTSIKMELTGKIKTPNLNDFDNIIVFVHSFSSIIKKKLHGVLKKIHKEREDIIIILLDDPYEIDDIQEINTVLCSFGFRNIQVEAALKTLLSYR